MNSKNIVFATNLKVWSISKGVGAPSFYKTLELYNKKGFNIDLYTTEKDLDIAELENVNIIKLPKLPIVKIKFVYSFIRTLNYLLYQLSFLVVYLWNQKRKADIFYGYEVEFIPILKLLSLIQGRVLVSRFQGTILEPLMKRRFWKVRYFPHYFSMRLNADLTIMTDDGTNGNKVIKAIRGHDKQLLFIKNGVSFSEQVNRRLTPFVDRLCASTVDYKYNFISVSRLQTWKRLDRSIDVFEGFIKQCNEKSRYIIVGDGEARRFLKKYVLEKGLDKHVIFTGGLDTKDVEALMQASNIFLSHYELSNVGNPLWEAMRNNCLVVTINNGETNKVIQDGYNGIISEEENYMDNIEKLLHLVEAGFFLDDLNQHAHETLHRHVVSWDERMEKEFEAVLATLSSKG